jgi:hypothetical protein
MEVVMFKVISNIFSNLWYVLSGQKKEDDKLEEKFMIVWNKRIEQRMDPEFDWDTMTHPDDNVSTYGDAKRNADPCNGGDTLDEVWSRAVKLQSDDDEVLEELI